MKRMLIIIIILISIFIYSDDNIISIKRNDFSKINKIFKSIDIIGKNKDYLFIHVNNKDLYLLQNNAIKYSLIDFSINKASFLSLNEAYDYMDSLHIKYPSITKIETLGFTYQYNLPLKILKIGNTTINNYNNENTFLLMGMHHAREWQTVSQVLFFADSLLQSYSTDTLVNNIINNDLIIVFPIVNPDGYTFSHDSSNTFWRKNRTLRNTYYGVDLNRNYSGGINSILASDWGFLSNSATSHDPTSDVYCGPYSNSEREVQAVQSIIKNYNVRISISLHSYGQEIIWPWGSVTFGAPDSALMEGLARQMAVRMRKQNGTSIYDAEQSAILYPTTGDSDDWIYGWTKFVKGKTTIPFTFEIDDNFNSSTSEELDSLFRRVYPGILYGLIMIDSMDNRIFECPMKQELSFIYDTLKWEGDNAEEADFFRIKYYNGMLNICDSINNENLYKTIGFEKTDYRAYSGDSSFMVVNETSTAQILENKYKYLVKENDSLIFYIYYGLEGFDKGVVEVSENGFEYEIIDTINGIFSGTNSTWERVAISLNNYAGKEIYYRFRIIFDSSIFGDGVYIDNIYPIIQFNIDSTYMDSINSMFIQTNIDIGNENYFTVEPYWKDFQYINISNRLLCNINTINIRDIESDSTYMEFDIYEKTMYFHNFHDDLNISIYNIMGQRVYYVNLPSNTEKLNVSFLDNGKYFVKISNNFIRETGILILK